MIRGANLNEEHVRFKDYEFVYVTLEKASELTKNMAYPGDLIFTQRGTLGQIGLIPLESRFKEYVVSQSQMKLTPNLELVEPDYLFHFCRSATFLKLIYRSTIATGLPHINLGILKSLPLPLPPLPEQRHISSVVNAIDDKIKSTFEKRRATMAIKKALMQDLLTGKVRVQVS